MQLALMGWKHVIVLRENVCEMDEWKPFKWKPFCLFSERLSACALRWAFSALTMKHVYVSCIHLYGISLCHVFIIDDRWIAGLCRPFLRDGSWIVVMSCGLFPRVSFYV